MSSEPLTLEAANKMFSEMCSKMVKQISEVNNEMFSKLDVRLTALERAAQKTSDLTPIADVPKIEERFETPSDDEAAEDEQNVTFLLQTLQSDTARRARLGQVLADTENQLPSNPSRQKRRETIFQRQLRVANESANPLVIHGTQPPYEHIKLEYLSIGRIFDFFDKILEYESTTSISLPVTSLVATAVRQQIISWFHPKLTLRSFLALSTRELYVLSQEIVKPQSEIAFLEALSKTVKWEGTGSSSYMPVVTNFLPFYKAVLLYKEKYLRVYEFVALNNETNVPACTNKEGGLIKHFIDQIPFEYGKRVWLRFGKTKRDATYDIYKFLADFDAILQESRKICESTRMVRELFGGTAYEAFKKSATSLHELHSIATDCTDEPYSPVDDADPYDDFDEQLHYLQSGKPQGITASTPASKPALACITKVLYGSCDKNSCKWSHDPKLIAETREKYVTLIVEQQKKSVSSLRPNPEALLHRKTGSSNRVSLITEAVSAAEDLQVSDDDN